MTHPKHKPSPKGKRTKGITPNRSLPIGLRSAKLIRDNAKSAVIVPVSEQPWTISLVIGEVIHMPINFKGQGFIKAKVTGACFHPTLAAIPGCELGHASAQFDAGADWHTVLTKAAWGSNRAAPTTEMSARSAKGWFVIDFEPTHFPREWQARAKKRRAQTEESSMSFLPVTPDTLSRFDEVPSSPVESTPVV